MVSASPRSLSPFPRSIFRLASGVGRLLGLETGRIWRVLPLIHTSLLKTQLTYQDHHMAGLIHSLQAAQIDPAIETISGSPMTARNGKYFPQLERRVDRSIFTEAGLSPPKTGDFHCNVPKSSSPSSDRVKNIRESPNWRDKEVNFVRRSGNHGEDPFISSVNAGQSQGQDTHHSLRCVQCAYCSR